MYKNQRAKLKLLLFLSVLSPCTAMARLDEPSQAKVDSFEKLPDFLKKLEKKHNVSFVYDASEVSKDIDVTDNKNQSLESALKQLESKGISSKIIGNKIILKKIVVQPVQNHKSDAIIIKGRVTAAGKNSEPVPGTSVLEKGTTNGTSTDGDGNFTIKVNEGATLVFSSIGFKTKEVKVTSANINLNVQLEEDVNKLTEVEVVSTGYQQIDKKLFTGAAVALKGADVKQEGITDVSRMLEGKVAGVSVQNVSGTFGAAPKIRVRGATSITGENKPLWVIDGVILEDVVNISNEQLSTGDPSTLIGSSVAGINAEDIESFQILKDAAATAQYGARAMNGVIVITTKKGRIGKPVISYTSNFSSYLKPTYDSYNIMNSADQMSVYSELHRKGWLNHAQASRNANGGVFTKMYQEIYDYDQSSGKFGLENTPEARNAFLQRYANANTDWFDVLFKNSLLQEHSLSVSSGTDKSQLYFSASYLNDNGWAQGNNVNRYTANLNASFKFSEKVSANIITSGSIRDQKAPGTIGRVSNPVEGKYSRDFDINPFSYALNTSRTLTAFDQNGNREYFTSNFAPFNILSELENNTLDLNMIDFKVQGGLSYDIIPALKYSVLGSMRYAKTGQEHKVRENSNMAMAYRANGDSYVQDNNRFLYRNPDRPDDQPIVVLPYGGFYNTTDDFLKSYMVRNSLEYSKIFNEIHQINIYGLQEIRLANRQNKSNVGYGYQFDKGGVPYVDPNIIKQAIENNLPYYSMKNGYDRFAAFMARGAYSYKGKYSVNATVRYDGSNQLGSSTTARWLPTWNISGAWNADAEDFMKRQNVVTRMTLRATYGLTASLGSATNSSLILRNGTSLRPYLDESESIMNLYSLENSNLTWEKQYETNIGFDFGFWNDKLNLTVDLYNRDGFDLISPIRTSAIGGEYFKNANYADMKSKGIEVSIGSPIINKENFGWKTNLNFGYNQNEVTNLKGQPTIFELVGTDGGPQEGYPYRGLYSIQFTGLNSENGVPEFINEKGEVSNNVYVQSDIVKYLKYEGPTDPKLTGGFYNQLRYKNFTVSALVSFSAGNKIRLNPIFANSYSDMDATPQEFKNRWTLSGDESKTNIPAILYRETEADIAGSYPYSAYNYSTARVADGGFIRLKQVAVTYNLPKNVLKSIGFTNVSISLIGNNIGLLYSDKRLNGQDPEFFASGGVALPIPRQYTMSLKLGL